MTASQFALAYVIHRPEVVAIPGASGIEQVEANAAAAEIELADDEYAAPAAPATATATATATARAFRPVTGIGTLPARLAVFRHRPQRLTPRHSFSPARQGCSRTARPNR